MALPRITGPIRGVLPTSAEQRAAAIISDVIARAATRADRGVAFVRLIVSGLLLVGWTAVSWRELRAGALYAWGPTAGAIIGLGSAAGFLLYYRRGVARLGHLVGSICLDAGITNLGVAAYVLAPHAQYQGVFSIIGVNIVFLSMAASGARLSRRGVGVAAVVHLAPLLIFAILDLARGLPIAPELNDLPVVATTAAGSLALAWWVCVHARHLVVESATGAAQAEHAQQLLGAYADDGVAQHLLNSGELRLTGEEKQVAILFSDLRGFTTFSEGLPPEELLRQLNRYFRDMVDAIKAEGGTVDKFIGDAIMAVFGAPVDQPDAAARAIRAARRMSQALVSHNSYRASKGQAPFRQGVGVHYGVVVAGNLGTEGRANYTVIGDAVNVASRLESATKELKVPVLISEAAAMAAPEEATREVGTLQVKGRTEPVHVFTLDR